MRIAAISDIHGNLGALEAVLADIGGRGVDLIVNLGDVVSGPLYPAETATLLMSLALPTIQGNHERQLLTWSEDCMGFSDRYASACLDEAQKAWLRALPASLTLHDVLLVHGTPSDDTGYFVETVTPSGCRAATRAEVSERAAGATARVVLCGHTHIGRSVELDDGRLVVNPGSVGLPAYENDQPMPHRIETGSPHARYAVLDLTKTSPAAEVIAVAYDWETAARQAERLDRPDWARALRTGRI